VKTAGTDRTPADFAQLSVSDVGCGMSPEVLARVFEPFFTTKDVGKGSGLGLPQVYGFAQQSGGQLTIESAVGKGTVVTLLLPRSLREPVASTDARGESPVRSDRARRGLALLVEDDAEVAALTHDLLNHLGFDVIHAASPEPRWRPWPTHGMSMSCSRTS
jgi:hypothetical protein